jgi:hypothetical protein
VRRPWNPHSRVGQALPASDAVGITPLPSLTVPCPRCVIQLRRRADAIPPFYGGDRGAVGQDLAQQCALLHRSTRRPPNPGTPMRHPREGVRRPGGSSLASEETLDEHLAPLHTPPRGGAGHRNPVTKCGPWQHACAEPPDHDKVVHSGGGVGGSLAIFLSSRRDVTAATSRPSLVHRSRLEPRPEFICLPTRPLWGTSLGSWSLPVSRWNYNCPCTRRLTNLLVVRHFPHCLALGLPIRRRPSCPPGLVWICTQ